jgi:signal transduction histidine kinase/ligand-binding sensor domain-containing protein
VALAVLAVATSAAVAASGGEPRIQRLVRVYDWTNGFPWSYAGGVEQDRRGFLWLTTTSGLYRFDGTRAHRVSDAIGVAPGGTAAGRVVVYASSGATFEATAEGLVRLDAEASASEPGSLSVAVATDGTPWRVRDGTVERLGPDRAWRALEIHSTPGDPPRLVRPGRNGRVYVASASMVWAAAADGSIRPVAPVERALQVVERADGTLVVGANQNPGPITTRLFEVTGGRARAVYEERGARLISIVERGDKLWVAMDVGLQALGRGYQPQDRIASPAIPTCGHLVVDREGSLWMATARGLVQIPEPDVYAVAPARAGVTRDIARTARGVWGTFWGTLAFLSDAPGPVSFTEAGRPHYTTLCRDGSDRVWTAGGEGILRLDPDGSLGPSVAGDWEPHGCGDGGSSRRWIVSRDHDLWTVQPGEGRPRLVPLHFDDDVRLSFAAEAGDGTLWLARGATMCGAPAREVLSGSTVSWTCERIPDGHDVIDLQGMPSGDVWALTAFTGSIRRRAGGTWETIPGSKRLGVNWVSAITPSPSGGVWLVGQGIVVRVAERPDLPDGWEVLERPTAWNGLLTLNVVAIEEDADGTLWLGTDVGIQRIPAEIRRRRADPPGVELFEGSVNGAPLDATAPSRLPYRRNRLETHFAALTYRDPGAVRYRMRLHGEDPWSADQVDGHFTFVDLPPGRYDLEVAASLDGSRWSQPSAHLSFRVSRPWFAQPLVLGGAVLGTALAGHLGYRWRARRRLARERQRTRIAMDLHDEVGSGLGTIAVLAGIAGRPDVSEDRRDDVTARIAAVAQELGRSLGDIVWSLRTSSGSLDALWDQLLDRARPLFSSGRPRIAFEAPDPVPREALSLVVRRNLHLVVYEALHNAARHAGASVVTLRLVREGPGWRLEVEDDGRGISDNPAVPSVRRGLGIEAMKTRVAEMGGTIAWNRGEAGGTRVTVRFRTGDD